LDINATELVGSDAQYTALRQALAAAATQIPDVAGSAALTLTSLSTGEGRRNVPPTRFDPPLFPNFFVGS
jgi:hypothetical protein